MTQESEITIRPESLKPKQPIFPTSSAEYINSLSHYYRAEQARMISWRDRLDRTTNWAITGAGAMLSVSLSSPQSHHGVLLFAMVLIFLMLQIESRRYRFFDVYRSRVRLFERNYYARILSPREMIDPSHWMTKLGDDLRLPRFSLSHSEAMARRLRRNYIWLYLILLLAWLLKTTTVALQPAAGQVQIIHSPSEMIRNAAIGYVPGWLVIIVILSFYGWLTYLIVKHHEKPGELAYGEVHV